MAPFVGVTAPAQQQHSTAAFVPSFLQSTHPASALCKPAAWCDISGHVQVWLYSIFLWIYVTCSVIHRNESGKG